MGFNKKVIKAEIEEELWHEMLKYLDHHGQITHIIRSAIQKWVQEQRDIQGVQNVMRGFEINAGRSRSRAKKS